MWMSAFYLGSGGSGSATYLQAGTDISIDLYVNEISIDDAKDVEVLSIDDIGAEAVETMSIQDTE